MKYSISIAILIGSLMISCSIYMGLTYSKITFIDQCKIGIAKRLDEANVHVTNNDLMWECEQAFLNNGQWLSL